MGKNKIISMLYGHDGMELKVPAATTVLEGRHIPAISNPLSAIREALANPIGSAPLADVLRARRPRNVAITISDITRPVPNKIFLPPILECLNACGIPDDAIVIIIGAGMHRASTAAEREQLVGRDILGRMDVIDHTADKPQTLLRVSNDPPVSVCRRFAAAEFRIVTGYIEPHFMAGFSGGRKGVCPALVDLETVQRFHGYETLAHPAADTGRLENNPCHEIALQVARTVGVDFLFNVAITRDRRIAGIYCGDLEAAHQAGCQQVKDWTTAHIDHPFDFVITNGGGGPLDTTFYQTIKGMCSALPALGRHSTLLQVSQCLEKLGSEAFTELILHYDNDWQRFLADIAAHPGKTRLDQWEYQMQARVLERIGLEKLWFVSDGIPQAMQQHISVTPILGVNTARERAQHAIERYVAANPDARLAVIPEGPYTMLNHAVDSGMRYHTRHIPEELLDFSSATAEEVRENGLCDVLNPEGMRQLKAHGVDTIELRMVWWEFEPESGRFDWSRFDRDLLRVEHAGLKPGVFIWLQHPPEWYLRLEQRAACFQCLEHGAVTTSLSLWDPETLRIQERLLRVIAERYQGRFDFVYMGFSGDFGEPVLPQGVRERGDRPAVMSMRRFWFSGRSEAGGSVFLAKTA